MDISVVLAVCFYLIFGAQGLIAVWGFYNAILVYRGIAKRSIDDDSARTLLERVREKLGPTGKTQDAIEICQNPPYWHTALAQLFVVGLTTMGKGLAKVKQALVSEFHTQIISAMENRLASIGTAAKLEPLLGLLGTVIGMIGAFGNVSEGQRATDPGSQLAASIAGGLWTTAVGLIIATPLILLANDLQARLRRLRDRTERQLQDFLDDIEAREVAATGGGRGPSRPGSGTVRSVLPR
ncbi:hypothetical protein BH23PLA1_BH23PLA1_03520 [soil metagenome]